MPPGCSASPALHLQTLTNVPSKNVPSIAVSECCLQGTHKEIVASAQDGSCNNQLFFVSLCWPSFNTVCGLPLRSNCLRAGKQAMLLLSFRSIFERECEPMRQIQSHSQGRILLHPKHQQLLVEAVEGALERGHHSLVVDVQSATCANYCRALKLRMQLAAASVVPDHWVL